MDDETKEGQKKRADAIHDAIEKAKAGQAPAPKNPRDFIHERMAEEAAKAKKPGKRKKP